MCDTGRCHQILLKINCDPFLYAQDLQIVVNDLAYLLLFQNWLLLLFYVLISLFFFKIFQIAIQDLFCNWQIFTVWLLKLYHKFLWALIFTVLEYHWYWSKHHGIPIYSGKLKPVFINIGCDETEVGILRFNGKLTVLTELGIFKTELSRKFLSKKTWKHQKVS